jgi:hypothetical protein
MAEVTVKYQSLKYVVTMKINIPEATDQVKADGLAFRFHLVRHSHMGGSRIKIFIGMLSRA